MAFKVQTAMGLVICDTVEEVIGLQNGMFSVIKMKVKEKTLWPEEKIPKSVLFSHKKVAKALGLKQTSFSSFLSKLKKEGIGVTAVLKKGMKYYHDYDLKGLLEVKKERDLKFREGSKKRVEGLWATGKAGPQLRKQNVKS